MSSRMLQVMLVLSVAAALGFWSAVLLFLASERRSNARNQPARNSGTSLLRSLLDVIQVPSWFLNRSGDDRFVMLHVGLPLTVEEFRSLRWILLLGGGIGAILLGMWRNWDLLGWSLCLMAMIGTISSPQLWIRRRRERRISNLEFALPDLMDRLRLGLGAGLGFEPALRRVAARFPGDLGQELRRLLRQIDMGISRGDAMIEMAMRNPSPSLRRFVSSINQADRLGSSLNRILQVESIRLRAERHRRAEEASRRLPVLIVFPLVFFFLPALLVVYLAPPLLHILLSK